MNKALLLAFLALLAVPAALAVSGNDAVNLVVNQSHFLYDGETYTPPNVSIGHGENSYWVVPITAGRDIVTYFAVVARTGALPPSNAVNRPLYAVADSLRGLQLMKESLAPNSGVEWIFTQ